MNASSEPEKPDLKRYNCPSCGYSWVECVCHIVEKREGSDDLHLRIGEGTPSECHACGCCHVYETNLPEKDKEVARTSNYMTKILITSK